MEMAESYFFVAVSVPAPAGEINIVVSPIFVSTPVLVPVPGRVLLVPPVGVPVADWVLLTNVSVTLAVPP